MAAHLDDQQELENFKYFWNKGGKWLFALMLAAALAYLGWVIYGSHQQSRNAEAAALLVTLTEKAQAKDEAGINSTLQQLQQNYTDSIAAAQASMMVAGSEFDKGSYDAAAAHLAWVQKHQKSPFIQTLAAQRLAVVKLQQKKYDEALAVLNIQTDAAFEPLLLETKGDILAAQDKDKDALAAYEQALAKLPQDDPSRSLLQMKAEQLK